ncbi:MAG: peptide ABC transporter substrate-binding protein [Dehalococcoidia bacterium]|nr:peptide ABC transporter substrate-binding protein [Dehalococcoidia bacterium]
MKLCAVACAALLMVTTVACGGAAGTSSSGGGAGQLTVFGSEPPTLDPALMSDTSASEYVVEIFSGLVSLNTQLQIVPDIAESWDISKDGATYTFKLRDNVKFHSGKPVTAKDFKYSWERATDPKLGSATADTYLGDIKGVAEKLEGKAQEISGVKALDDRTLQVELEAPRFYFLAKMTYPTSFVVDKENVDSGGKTWIDKPNGTGPFRLTEWKKGERIVLERNSNYYQEPAKLTKINFLLAGGSAMTMYENNEVDISGVGINDIERIKDSSNPLNKEFVIAPSLDIWYVGFNTEVPPFDDAKVRQAFTAAIDRDKIANVVWKGLLTRADGVLPPGLPGYNSGVQAIKFDPARAKQLLQESKYRGTLPPITYTIPSSSTTIGPASEALLEMIRTNLGVEVKVQQSEWAQFLGDVKRNPLQNKKNKYQMYELGWSADYPDPQNFVDILFYSKSLDNNGSYSNPQVDRLIEQARGDPNPGDRSKKYQEAEQLLVSDAAVVPLYHGKHYQLVKPKVKGYKPAPMTISHYRYISVE